VVHVVAIGALPNETPFDVPRKTLATLLLLPHYSIGVSHTILRVTFVCI